MKICMVVYSLEAFGGLEEIVTTLALGLQQRGHQLSVLSTGWVAPDNQYVRSLHERGIPFVQLPRWLAYPASHWPTKESILASILWLLTPLTYILAGLLCLSKAQAWSLSRRSAHNWLRGHLMRRWIGPDRREPLVRLLLHWWQLCWQPDLLHIHGFYSQTHSLLFVVDWAAVHSMPVVYEEHQTPDLQFDSWQGFAQSVNQAAVVVAVSEKSAQALRSVCGVTQPIVIANPIVAGPLIDKPAPDGTALLEEVQRERPLQVTTVARLYGMKGLTYLLEAIAQIRAVHPTVEFRVYGDGPLRQALLAQAHQLGLDGARIFVGAFQRQALPTLLAQTDIFVLPSVLEGLPLSVVEAMAYARPIVATAVGGVPELIQHGVNGLLCQPSDAADLAQKLQMLIEAPALRCKLSLAARQTYEQGPFQPNAVCEHFLAIYRQVVTQRSVQPARNRSWASTN